MSKVLVCSDFHLGKVLRSHTNTASQKRMQELVYQRAADIMRNAGAGTPVVNLGDLFDTYSNPEAVILQGCDIASRCVVVLQGNHDVKNIEGHVSSLDVAHAALSQTEDGSPVIRREDVGQFTTVRAGNALFYCIPHQLSQEDFAEAVRSACAYYRDHGPDQDHGPEHPDQSLQGVLALHCNVSDGYGDEVDPSGSGLYLTTELQELVSSHFRLTLVGHEHIARTVFPHGRGSKDHGRIQIVGNHFPMGFGELDDRYVWTLDTETLEMTPCQVFDRSHEVAEVQAHDLLDESAWNDFPVHEDTLFVDVRGEADMADRPAISRALLKLWREWPHLLAVRNNVEFFGGVQRPDRSRTGESMVQALSRNASVAGFKLQLEQIMQELNLDLELDASAADGVDQVAAELRTATKEDSQ